MTEMTTGDRVVWIGPDTDTLPRGSTGKYYDPADLRTERIPRSGEWAFVNWGEGAEGWYPAEWISKYDPDNPVPDASVEERLEALIAHANEGARKYYAKMDARAFASNMSRRAGLEDALKVVRGEPDSIGDAA